MQQCNHAREASREGRFHVRCRLSIHVISSLQTYHIRCEPCRGLSRNTYCATARVHRMHRELHHRVEPKCLWLYRSLAFSDRRRCCKQWYRRESCQAYRYWSCNLWKERFRRQPNRLPFGWPSKSLPVTKQGIAS